MSTSGGTRASTSRRGGTIPLSQAQRDRHAAQNAARRAEFEQSVAKAAKASGRGKGQSSKTAAERAALKNSEATRGLAQAETLKESYKGYFVFIRYPDGTARVYGHDAERIGKMLKTKPQQVETGNFHVDSQENTIVEERVPGLRLTPEQYAEATRRVGAAHFPYVWADYLAHGARAGHEHVQEPAQKWRQSGPLSTKRSRRGSAGNPTIKSLNTYRKALDKSISDLQKPKVTGRGKNRVETPAKLTAKQRGQIASAKLQQSYLDRVHIRTGIDAERALDALRPNNRAQPGQTRTPRRGAANRDARTALVKALTGAATRAAETMKVSTARMIGRQLSELNNVLDVMPAPKRGDMTDSAKQFRAMRTQIRGQMRVLSNHLMRADRLYQLSRGRGAKANYFSGAAENAMRAK